MKKTNFTTRAYVLKTGQIMVRVRWCSKKCEVGFSVGYTIDPQKWDSTKQMVKSNTTHKISGKTIYAREINNAIHYFLGDYIRQYPKFCGNKLFSFSERYLQILGYFDALV